VLAYIPATLVASDEYDEVKEDIHMNDDKTEGKMDELKGKAKQAWGDATDNQSLRDEGKADEAKGHGKQAMGKAKDAVDDAKDSIEDAFDRDKH
jgi:uncharacterized protein YjbJ (UPF0337 family)